MYIKNKLFMVASVALILAANAAAVADWEDSQGDQRDVAIERKFTRSAPEQEGRPQVRSRVDPQQDAARHGLLAQLLVLQTGLYRYLPLNPTDYECFVILALNGIEPLGGWDAGKVVTRGDLARVIGQALGLHDRVRDQADPRAWMDALATMNIQITTIGEAVQHVGPISHRALVFPVFDPVGPAGEQVITPPDLAFVIRNVFPPETRKPVTPD